MYLQEILFKVIFNSFERKDIGVIINGINDLDIDSFLSLLDSKIDKKYYVAIIDYPVQDNHYSNLEIAKNIEKAVEWRSTPDCAQRIIVILKNDTAKMHSLAEFSTISTRDISTYLVKSYIKVSSNVPIKKFWEAIEENIANFPYILLADFCKNSDNDNASSLLDNLWRLGLIRDNYLFNTNNDISQLIVRNQEVLHQMATLNDVSRRRLSNSLAKSTGSEQAEMKKNHDLILDYFKYGKKETLKGLDMKYVEKLILASKGKTTKKTTKKKKEKEDNEGVIKTSEFIDMIDRDFIENEGETSEGLKKCLDSVRDYFDSIDDEDFDSTNNINVSLDENDDKTLVPPNREQDLVRFMSQFSSAQNWGGKIVSNEDSINSILVDETAASYPFDIESKGDEPQDLARYGGFISLGYNDDKLEDILGRFDEDLLKKGKESNFKDLFLKIKASREVLAKDINLILYYPTLLFAGDEKNRTNLFDYINNYKDLYELFNKNKSDMESISQGTVRHLIQVLLSIDLVFVYKEDESLSKVIMTPLNPLFLWKYYEIFRNIKPGAIKDENDKKALIECLNSLPNLITHLYVKDFDGEGRNIQFCGLVKNKLPFYENNRLKGTDGINVIPEILTRWTTYAPYSINELRIAIVDCPDILETIKTVSQFTIQNKNRIIIDFYYKDIINHTSELAFLSELDDLVNEQVEKNRIVFHIHENQSNDDIEFKIRKSPVHIIFFFDQCSYISDFGQTEVQKTLSPLVATFDYQYDQYQKVGDIYPSTNTDMGILGAYHRFLRQNGFEEVDKSPLMKMKTKIDLKLANESLPNEFALWEVIADRNIYTYAPANAIAIGEKMLTKRNMCIYANEKSRIIGDFERLLKQYNLKPKSTILIDVLKQFAHISSEGLVTIPKNNSNQSIENRKKGLIGTIFSAYLYKLLHKEALVASLDTPEARLWISNYTDNNDRADLIGMWFDDEKHILNMDVIEVKTRDGDDPDLMHATEQVTKIVSIIENIFNTEHADIFCASRKEILKKQLVNECFRGIHDPDWQIKWDAIFKDAFSSDISKRTNAIKVNGHIFHIKLSSFDDGYLIPSKYNKDVIMNVVSSKDIQDYVFDKLDLNKERFENIVEMLDEEEIEEIEPVVDDDDELHLDDTKPVEETIIEQPEDNSHSKNQVSIETLSLFEKHKEEIYTIGKAFYKSCKQRNVGVTKEFENMIKDTIVGAKVYRFFFKLEPGKNMSSLENQLDDIGREIKRSGLIISAINNDDRIILDVPRQEFDEVNYESVQDKFTVVDSPEKLPFPIGREPNGNDVIKDLSEMPHMLIGGSTGSGKTVFLHAMICSLLLSHPNSEDLKLVISSAGIEDFVYFDGIPHLLNGKIITSANETVEVIKTIVNEQFEKRAAILAEARCKNIIEYNQTHENKLPSIVVIIDEFADISDQLQNKKEKEAFFNVVRRIVQIGRKRGIHMVLCTQRPSANLVPGDIKAQLNARLALRVNDSTSSRMILEEMGAQNLQKHGDLIFKSSDSDKIRAQGYYISTELVDSIIASIKK